MSKLERIFKNYTNISDFNSKPNLSNNIESISLFANFPVCRENEYFDKTIFNSVDFFPLCQKYSPSIPIEEIDPSEKTILPGGDIITIKVSILSLININHEHCLSLHPKRFDIVKRYISEGLLYSPSVMMVDGIPKIQQGRHRTVAMYKYDFKCMNIRVLENEKHIIAKLLAGEVKRKATNVNYNRKQRMTLGDWDFSQLNT